jgi:hypothetical protein
VKIPSEAELIEIEQRTLRLPEVIAYLERKADNLWGQAADATGKLEAKLIGEAERVQKAHDSLERLASDLEMLIELVRQAGRP